MGGPFWVEGLGERRRFGRHHEQVTLLSICSLSMYRTQPRPARPAQAPQQCHALRFGG
jgi:hypothetical protein